MPYARKKEGFSGGYQGRSKFGGAPHGRSFSDRGGEEKQLFPATCADCGARCEVPFRPNGKKPVLCKNCFAQKNDFEPRAPRHEEGPRRYEEAPRPMANDNTSELLRSINTKLDVIIKALEANDLSM